MSIYLFNRVIFSTLFLFHISNVSATSVETTKNNQKHLRQSKEKVVETPDIWERVRLGMKMPWVDDSTTPVITPPTPITTKEEIVVETDKSPEESPKSNYLIQPHKAIAPLHNYTELGAKIRFGENKPVVANATPKIIELKKPEPPKIVVVQHDLQKEKIHARIKKQIAFFTQKSGYLYAVTERARPYLYSIVNELSKKQLPLEIALLPIVESAYRPTAQSPKGAAGLWQFMPATGNDYGLKQNEQTDDRLDIQASTRAAIHFLMDLKAHYKGDWLLAFAAYNCGQGAVDNAISKNISAGLKTDYWSLDLPKETQDYVPRLLALSTIFANPSQYGVKFAPIKNEPFLIKAKIGDNQG